MCRRALLWIPVFLGPTVSVAAEPVVPAPFFDLRQQRTEYAGPGRDLPAPADLKEILIGYFGPSDPADARNGDLWCAAQLAVEEANAAGGFQGKPWRLVGAWADNPWGSGVQQLTRLVFDQRVWAIIGGIDGPATHLAEQIVVKARLPLLSPISTDKTVHLVNVPWMFSLAPGDHRLATALAQALMAEVGDRPFVRIATAEHDAKVFAQECDKAWGAHRRAAAYKFECPAGVQDLAPLTQRILTTQAAAAVVLADAEDSARLVAALRNGGFAGMICGGPALGRHRFLTQAAAAAEGVVFPLLCDPDRIPAPFAEAFRHRCGHAPDYAAAQTYDAVWLLVAAVRKAGLNRARLRDALAEMSPWTGVSGAVIWDGTGANTRSPMLGTVRQGRVLRQLQ
jgi:ABC-type branched-subunit amino acid transport system substrate-binding protein